MCEFWPAARFATGQAIYTWQKPMISLKLASSRNSSGASRCELLGPSEGTIVTSCERRSAQLCRVPFLPLSWWLSWILMNHGRGIPFEAIRALDAKDLYKILTEAEDSILLQFQMPGRIF